MTDFDVSHAPSAEFRSALERDVLQAFKRESQFSPPARAATGRLRAVLLIALGMVLGVGTGFARAQVQDARLRSDLLEAQLAAQQLVALRVELVKMHVDQTLRLFERGVITRRELSSAESQLKDIESLARRGAVDIEEIRATSASPRNELWAPLVGARDFVMERLKIEAQRAQEQLTAAEANSADAERAVRTGVITTAARTEAALVELDFRSNLELLAQRMEIRKQFLAETIAPADIELRIQRSVLRSQVQRLQKKVEQAAERARMTAQQQKVGAVSELEVKRAEVDHLERKLELERAVKALAALEAAGKAPSR